MKTLVIKTWTAIITTFVSMFLQSMNVSLFYEWFIHPCLLQDTLPLHQAMPLLLILKYLIFSTLLDLALFLNLKEEDTSELRRLAVMAIAFPLGLLLIGTVIHFT